jgi:SAM-dependent methyltransferase
LVTGFEPGPFSRASTYVELNREFVREVLRATEPLRYIVDLACGDGLLTELVLDSHAWVRPPLSDLLPEPRELTVFGIDASEVALAMADRRLGAAAHAVSRRGTGERIGLCIRLARADGIALPIADGTVDAVLLGNAIHCFTDKRVAAAEVHRVLRHGGAFAFNTAFYAGTMVSGTEEFYGEWIKEAVRLLITQGQYPLHRKRGGGAFVNRWLGPDEYSRMLHELGFEIMQVSERRVELSRADFLGLAVNDAGSWEPGLVSVLLPGYPSNLACEALRKGIDVAIEIARLPSVPRFWLEVICRRSD